MFAGKAHHWEQAFAFFVLDRTELAICIYRVLHAGGYVGTAEDSNRIRRQEKQREEQRKKHEVWDAPISSLMDFAAVQDCSSPWQCSSNKSSCSFITGSAKRGREPRGGCWPAPVFNHDH